jgi:hypothetical protein
LLPAPLSRRRRHGTGAPMSVILTYLPHLLQGLVVTLQVAAGS